MEAKRIRSIAVAIAEVEKGLEFTDLADKLAELDWADWRRKVLMAALDTAAGHLVKAREAFCALTHALGEKIDLDNPATVNRLGHWACNDVPPVFAETVPLPTEERPRTF